MKQLLFFILISSCWGCSSDNQVLINKLEGRWLLESATFSKSDKGLKDSTITRNANMSISFDNCDAKNGQTAGSANPCNAIFYLGNKSFTRSYVATTSVGGTLMFNSTLDADKETKNQFEYYWLENFKIDQLDENTLKYSTNLGYIYESKVFIFKRK